MTVYDKLVVLSKVINVDSKGVDDDRGGRRMLPRVSPWYVNESENP